MSGYAETAVFAIHVCFAILVCGLVTLDLVVAEAFLTHGNMSPLSAPITTSRVP
jgi:hypothetical protein